MEDENILIANSPQDKTWFDSKDDLIDVSTFKTDIDENPGVLESAFKQENLLVNIYDAIHPKKFKHDEEFDITEYDLSDYGEYRGDLYKAQSAEELTSIINKIDQENEYRERIAESGWSGIGALVLAGVLDPTTLIPIAGATYKASRVGMAVSGAIKGGASVAATETAREAILHDAQETRTLEESVSNVIAASTFASVLTGMVGGLSKGVTGKTVDDLKEFDANQVKLLQDKGLSTNKIYDELSPHTLTEQNVNDVSNYVLNLSDETVSNHNVTIAYDSNNVLTMTYKPSSDDIVDQKAMSAYNPNTGLTKLDKPLSNEPVVPKDGGAAYVGEGATAEDEMNDLVNPGIYKRFGIGPSFRMATSLFKNAREFITIAVYDGIKRKGNISGLLVQDDIATAIKARDADKNAIFKELNIFYADYVKHMKAENKPYMSSQEFKKEVSRASRRGDSHDIAEVAAAAKSVRKYLNKISDEAKALGFLPDDVHVAYAMSYLPRIYNKDEIIGDALGFKALIREGLQEQNGDLDLDIIEDMANSIFDNITGNSSSIGKRVKSNTESVLKERKIAISDELLEEFFENDIEKIIDRYAKSLVPKIEIKRRLGDDSGELFKKKLKDEYHELLNKPEYKSPEARKKLKKERDDMLALMDHIINNLKGNVDNGLNPNGTGYKVYKTIKALNNMTMLGGVAISSIPDIGRLMWNNSLSRVAKVFVNRAANNNISKLSATELSRFIAVLELSNAERGRLLAGLDYSDIYADDKYLKFLDAFETRFFKATFLPHFTRTVKLTNAMMTAGRIWDASEILNAGKQLKTRELKALYDIGLTDDIIKRAGDLIKSTPDSLVDEGVVFLNLEKWADQETAGIIKRAIIRDTDNIILTPNPADLPPFMQQWYGALFMQFKSFLILGHNKIFLKALDDPNAQVVTSILSMVALGALSAQAKQALKGEDFIEDPKDLLFEAVDRSGVLTLPMEIDNIADKLSNNKYSLRAMLDSSESKRFASRNKFGAFLGPSFNTVSNIFDLTNDNSEEKQRRLLRKMIPYNNMFYLRKAFDELEEL